MLLLREAFFLHRTKLMSNTGPIGVFDSGYGGLTILSEIRKLLPQYDYCYLGDNARAPYGSRSFEVIYEFTKQAVSALFDQGCSLVILACNTASAKALRTIQQKDLPSWNPNKRVLGVIRPTTEMIGSITKSRHVGILATEGTIQSFSYNLEIAKLFPDIEVTGEACPIWVPLVENCLYENEGADYFIKQNLSNILAKDSLIDTLILGCTHYPILADRIKGFLPEGITVISQGSYVASSLKDYLKRHPEMDANCSKGGSVKYLTTESPQRFTQMAERFLGEAVIAQHFVIA